MISYRYVISDRKGLHASNALSLNKAAMDYESRITLSDETSTADCKNVMSILNLRARQGDTITLTVEGPDEDQAAGYLKGLMRTVL
ncbi:MAG: HPr family phosphocarrier protein [Enterocloster sp.]